MKKIVFSLLSFLMFSLILLAKDIDESQVPKAVKDYVTKNYPNAVDKEWKYKDKDNTFYYYKVEFEVEGREVELELESNGKLISSKEELHIKDTPSFAKDYIKTNYPNATILGTKKKVERGVTTYDVGIVFNNHYGNIRHRNIYFDTKGNVMKQ
ncbi:PepSY-like domain-containing protein [Apibacter sp. HY039]|uniref:PepSY-like domain-containing protein n=1 Tax=Apibacter sp. HY039 TaxID=2501476 RepID=UPI000FEBCC40|nr:PepSY-like domain-containing protein [Apibacter sp. HY039]